MDLSDDGEDRIGCGVDIIEAATGSLMSTITIRIPDRTEAKLQQIAKAAGKPLEQLVGDVLEAQTSGRKILEEISGDIHKRFLASGMTDEELAERLEREDHQARGVRYDE